MDTFQSQEGGCSALQSMHSWGSVCLGWGETTARAEHREQPQEMQQSARHSPITVFLRGAICGNGSGSGPPCARETCTDQEESNGGPPT